MKKTSAEVAGTTKCVVIPASSTTALLHYCTTALLRYCVTALLQTYMKSSTVSGVTSLKGMKTVLSTSSPLTNEIAVSIEPAP